VIFSQYLIHFSVIHFPVIQARSGNIDNRAIQNPTFIGDFSELFVISSKLVEVLFTHVSV